MSATDPAAKKSRYLLTDWNPNDESKWDSKLAWRTLWITTYSLILAFCVWFLPSAIAPKLTLLGFNLDKSQLYWLTALPGLAAGILRLIYMFLPPLIGTRKLVGITSLLCVIPMLGWFFAVQSTETSFGTLLALAFACGRVPTAVSYPNGKCTERTRTAAGWFYAYGVRTFDGTYLTGTDPLLIPRTAIPRGMPPDQFKAACQTE